MPATDLERLVVQLSADITRYEKNLNRALGVTSATSKKILQQTSSLNSGVSKSFDGLAARALAAFTVIGGAKAFESLSDGATKITNALKTTGLAGSDLQTVYDGLYASAQKNGAPLESLVQLYSRVSVVQTELGVTSGQLIGLTDNVGKSLKITGSSAEEASGTLLQLAQAFGGNKIQAQEYNSLIDGALPLLKAAAAGIKQAGGSVATLTALVKAGKISNKAFFDGIQAGGYVLDEALSGSVPTIGQAFTNLNNALLKTVGKFNDTTGASTKVASALQSVADVLPNIDFTNVVAGVNTITAALETAIGKASGLIGKLLEAGRTSIGSDALDAIVESQDTSVGHIVDQMNEIAANSPGKELLALDQQRLSVNQKIADLQKGIAAGDYDANIDAARGQLANLSGDLDAINKQQVALASPAGNTTPFSYPERPHSRAPISEATKGAVDITQSQYVPKGDDATKKGGRKSDPFKSEIESIQKRTAATVAETAAQAKLNPLIDDYGFSVAKAKEQSLLETAAKEANKKVTPELTAQINNLSTAYANSVASANRLDEAQQVLAQRQQDIISTSKDVSRSIVDGFIQGESAAKLFSNALSQISSKILDIGFDTLFNPASKGGLGLGTTIAKLFGFKDGGFTGPGGKNQPAGIVHKGEYVVPKKVVDAIGLSNLEQRLKGYADGGFVGAAPTVRTLPRSSGRAASGSSYAPVYNIDARGADQAAVARMQRGLEERDRTESKRFASFQKVSQVRKVRA